MQKALYQPPPRLRTVAFDVAADLLQIGDGPLEKSDLPGHLSSRRRAVFSLTPRSPALTSASASFRSRYSSRRAWSRSYAARLMTTKSPLPFLVMKTGSPLSWQISSISDALFRRSEIGRMMGIA